MSQSSCYDCNQVRAEIVGGSDGKCSNCHGTGKDSDWVDEFFDLGSEDCSDCDGSGVCQTCDGEGLVDD